MKIHRISINHFKILNYTAHCMSFRIIVTEKVICWLSLIIICVLIREAFKKKIKGVDFFNTGGGQPQIHTFL